jgi:hypothetical protein
MLFSLKIRSILLGCTLSLLGIAYNSFAQDKGVVEGYINSTEGKPLALVNIVNEQFNTGVASTDDGYYRISIPQSDSTFLVFSSLGYASQRVLVSVRRDEKIILNIILTPTSSEIDQVAITISNKRYGNIERINYKDIEFLPSASGSFESILKSLPGVSASHEMSSQYSVRGGNFDENLVYVNDIEIYRPFLIRSGQQEGLSFINSDMVEGVEFSAGGFNAEYGDKMSSVLNIRYKIPNENAAKTELSLLGANGLVEGISENGRFTHLSAIRYKTSRYLLNTLDVGGDYNPAFVDFQTNMAWRFSPKFRLSYLGNYSSNQYDFTPDIRETRFGSFSNALQLRVFYQGQEVNKFETAQSALTGEYRPLENVLLKFIGSGYLANESETYDIIGQYLLNELDNTLGSTTLGDSLINVGIGGFINHARNKLKANFFRGEHIGIITNNSNTLKWGFSYQYEQISDRLNEWDLIDSSGYAVPYNGESLFLLNHIKSSNSIESNRFFGYIQNSYSHSFVGLDIVATGGVRVSYWNYNKEVNFSPRATILIKPDWRKDISFHISGGVYHQPPLFKEYRYRNGDLNPNISAQKSIHAVVGGEYFFMAWERPFRIQIELYHKELRNIIPYQIDNVRILYAGENLANGFAQGIDFKINGEFVKGAESWASLSVMRTYEDILNDSYVNEKDEVIYPGYYPRPTDQRFSLGLFFQDYFPRNPTYRVHLTGYFGTGYPVSIPGSPRWDILARMPSYKRVDIGFSKVFKGNGNDNTFTKMPWLNGLWLGVEVFNLFDFKNTISYLWVQTVSNQNLESGKYAVPNYLTSRRVNVKFSVNF